MEGKRVGEESLESENNIARDSPPPLWISSLAETGPTSHQTHGWEGKKQSTICFTIPAVFK